MIDYEVHLLFPSHSLHTPSHFHIKSPPFTDPNTPVNVQSFFSVENTPFHRRMCDYRPSLPFKIKCRSRRTAEGREQRCTAVSFPLRNSGFHIMLRKTRISRKRLSEKSQKSWVKKWDFKQSKCLCSVSKIQEGSFYLYSKTQKMGFKNHTVNVETFVLIKPCRSIFRFYWSAKDLLIPPV